MLRGVELHGAVAIVTGGGTGIGRAVCESLARAGVGAVVVNYSRSREEALETAATLEALGCRGIAQRADVSKEAEVAQMVGEVVARWSRLDVLINSAGTTRFIPHPDLDAVTDEVWDEILAVNVKGTFFCCRAAAEPLRRARGAIVNVASVSAFRAVGSSIPYAVSKAAVVQLTRSLAVALAPEVRVNAVAPGLVATRWFRRPLGEAAAEEQEARTAAVTPLRGVATAQHVAQAVMGLLASDFVSGECVVVDGGRHVLY